MDRPVEEKIQQQRLYKRIGGIALGLIVLLVGLWGVRELLSNKLDPDRIRTAVAELGTISNTLSASGEVMPAYEQVVVSPIQADIREVLIDVGQRVEPGDPILSLDKSFFLLNFDKQQQELELQQNSIKKLEFKLAKDQFDLEIQDSIQALEINSLEATLENAKKLLQVGGGTDEDVDHALLQLKIARLEKRQLEYDLQIKRQSTTIDLRELEIQANIQRNEIKQMEEKLKRAEVIAARPGVLTWANENIGSTVNEGETLARIADLGSYKITGTFSDIYADRIKIGQQVNVRLNEAETITGRIASIRPTVENNVISFDIQLDESDHAALRPSMRVELFIVTSTKLDVIRVANGPAIKGKAEQALFVMRDGVAEKRMVRVGLRNADFVELEANIDAGETIIISDMSRYEHMDRVEVKN